MLTGGARIIRLAALLAAGVVIGLTVANAGSLFKGSGRTTINQSSVVERLQSVAKLITTEAMVRDVVTYENRWMGSTKRSLVIVTGKALVGMDLGVPPQITIADRDRHLTLVFPRARLLGVDIVEMRTYDESRGLWNPFHPADRDTIFQIARRQLAHAAEDLAVLDHAEQSARELMVGLFTPEGWTVEVRFEPVERPQPTAERSRPD